MIYKVFLDTNIYDGANYSFHNTAFEEMRSLSADGKLYLVINSVIEGEVCDHIDRDVKKAAKELNSVITQRTLASFRHLDGFSILLERKNPDEWVTACKGEFDSFLTDCKAIHITVDGISAEKIISDYFEKKPPFEAKKPEEFKDAMASASLLLDIHAQFSGDRHANEDDIQYCVISNDAGFRKAIILGLSEEEKDNVRIFENLNVFVQHTTLMNRQTAFLQAFLLSESWQDELTETIRNAVEAAELNIELDGLCTIDEQDLIDIDEIKVTPYMLGIFEGDDSSLMAKVALDVSCELKVWYKYTDDNNSFWDKEDNAYLWKSEAEVEGTYAVSFEVVISIDARSCRVPDGWNEDEDYDFEDESVEFCDYIDMPSRIDLEQEYLVDEEILEQSDPFQEEYEDDGEITRSVAFDTCPDCGSPIGIENDGGNGFCIHCASRH